jgi:putative oxidoreductase
LRTAAREASAGLTLSGLAISSPLRRIAHVCGVDSFVKLLPNGAVRFHAPFERAAGFAPLVLRVVIGAHLIHGTLDNVLSWARMLEFRAFLAAEGFPFPLACAVVSVVAQFACGVLYLLGAFVRPASAIMLINFTVALLGVHLGDPYHVWFPAWVMWAGSLALLLSGAGRWSIDARRAHAAPS